MDDLLQANDPDLLAFVSDQSNRLDRREQFLLRAASDVVRHYCGWHIAPSITDTYDKLTIGSGGIIMLPSLYVTDVASVVIDSPAGAVTLNPLGDYTWFRQGYIEGTTPLWRYGYGSPIGYSTPGLATVTMTHGYATTPLVIKSVVFELMQAAEVYSSGGPKQVHSPGYSITWGDMSGVSISPEQISRLNSFKIGGLK